MNVLKLSLVAAVAAATMGAASAASAADVSFNVGAATDYVFRGIDQTGAAFDGEVFAGVDASFANKAYVGLWVSNTGPAVGGFNGFEADLYAGWKPTVGSVTLDLGAIYYGYNDGGFGNNANSDYELKAAASVPAGPVALTASVFYGPNNNAFGNANTTYVEGAASWTFRKVGISAALGNFSVASGGDYTTWNLGATVPVTDKVSLDARYIGTEGSAGLFNGVVGTLKATF
jgi:uncharacterized protein (TIGR02001 family)